MARTTKTDNTHKPHPTHCDRCYRTLPKRAHKSYCATCIKWLAGKPRGSDWLWSLTPAERAEMVQAANAHRASVGLPLIGRRARRDLTRLATDQRDTTAEAVA